MRTLQNDEISFLRQQNFICFYVALCVISWDQIVKLPLYYLIIKQNSPNINQFLNHTFARIFAWMNS